MLRQGREVSLLVPTQYPPSGCRTKWETLPMHLPTTIPPPKKKKKLQHWNTDEPPFPSPEINHIGLHAHAPGKGRDLGTETHMHHTTNNGHSWAVEWYHSCKKSLDSHTKGCRNMDKGWISASPRHRRKWVTPERSKKGADSFIWELQVRALGGGEDDTHQGKRESRNTRAGWSACGICSHTPVSWALSSIFLM